MHLRREPRGVKASSDAAVFPSFQAEPPKKPSNWRRKHEDFIATIRAAKGLTQVLKEGGPLPPPPPPSYDPGKLPHPRPHPPTTQTATVPALGPLPLLPLRSTSLIFPPPEEMSTLFGPPCDHDPRCASRLYPVPALCQKVQ